MDSKQFREAAVSSIDEIVKYYDNIEDHRVVSNVEPGYLRKILPEQAPEDGEAWSDIQKDLNEKIVPGLTHWQSPNFLAWFPASSSFPGMLGEMYSAAFTAANFNWVCSPAVTELETIVLDWMAKAFALPECYLSSGSTHGGGVIHGSASEAIVTVMVAARDKYLREATVGLTGEELEDAMATRRGKLVALGSEATHSATKKAAMIAGVRYRAVPVYAKDGYKLTGDGLGKVIEEVRAKGLEPFYLTVTMGTTDTCSIDDFESITSILTELAPPGPGEVWVHVDAAYAGAALVCPEYQPISKHFEHFHSFNTNLHKWLLTNFDCSFLYVKRRSWLIEALSVTLAILRNDYTDSGLVTDYRDWQIPFGRRFRSLKVWFVIRTYGTKGLQAHIRKHISLGERFASVTKSRDDLFEIVSGPRFALTVFKAKGKGNIEEQNALTKKIYEMVNSEGNIFCSSTVVGGIFAIRHVCATPFVDERHVDRHHQIFVEAAEKVLRT